MDRTWDSGCSSQLVIHLNPSLECQLHQMRNGKGSMEASSEVMREEQG